MTIRTVHENPTIDTPTMLSTLWTSILFADVLRGVHETLRPGFVDELAHQGTNYSREITDTTLLWSGVVLTFITSVVVLARVLPRRWNRRVNLAAAAMMAAGVLASWPKDPDDYVFGSFQLAGSILVAVICVRWRADADEAPAPPPSPAQTSTPGLALTDG